MGCFLECFGGSKDSKRRKRRNKVVSKDQLRDRVQDPAQSIVSEVQDTVKTQGSTAVQKPRSGEAEEGSSPSLRKRVTFNSNVTTYEPVSIDESIDSLPDTNGTTQKEKEGIVVKSRKDDSVSEDDSALSSVGSFPPNHRYQNCRVSDDDAEECGDSDLEDVDDDEDYFEDYEEYDEDVDCGIVGEVWSESVITDAMEPRTENSLARSNSEEVSSAFKPSYLLEQEAKGIGTNGCVRDRSAYIHSVLNPVENISQWKVLKSKTAPPLKSQKENFTEDAVAPRVSFSTEPTYRKSSSSLNPKSTQQKNINQEIAVDASLSNWLVSPGTMPNKKTICSGLKTFTSERSVSQDSNSVVSFEDRPILGALTVEELKQLSTTSSPRKSPSQSPDDMPIIGSVGSYWKETSSTKESGSANTTKKYRDVFMK